MQRLSRGRALVGVLVGTRRTTAKTVTANYTVAFADDTIIVNSANKIVTLPAAAKATGRRYTVKNMNITGTTVKATSGTIDGVAAGTGDTASLATAWLHAVYESDGVAWFSV